VRNEPLPIVGPSGNSVAGPAANDIAPDFPTFLARLFDEKSGAFGGTLGGKGNGVRLNAVSSMRRKRSPRRCSRANGQFDLAAAIADVKKSYTGALTVGADLQCTPVQ
jgi:hypothetical protein